MVGCSMSAALIADGQSLTGSRRCAVADGQSVRAPPESPFCGRQCRKLLLTLEDEISIVMSQCFQNSGPIGCRSGEEVVMDQGAVQVMFLIQVLVITGSLFWAAGRTRRLRRAARASAGRPRRREHDGAAPTAHTAYAAPTTASATDTPLIALDAALDEERERITRDLALLRAAHAEEESEFRARRRAALLEMQEYRRVSAALRPEQMKVEVHVRELQADVEHLEHRRTALADEVAASVERSRALRDRTVLARQELAALHLDRERVTRRIRTSKQQLRDLTHRRELLRAETEELSALLEMLQQLTGQSRTLTALSDSEMRSEPASPDAGRVLPVVLHHTARSVQQFSESLDTRGE